MKKRIEIPILLTNILLSTRSIFNLKILYQGIHNPTPLTSSHWDMRWTFCLVAAFLLAALTHNFRYQNFVNIFQRFHSL